MDNEKERLKKKEQILEPLKKDMMDKVKKWNIPDMDDDDKFQEVYLKCWTALDKYKEGSSPRTYLWRVIDNHLINMFKHSQINKPDNYYSTQSKEEDSIIEKIVDIKMLREQVINEIKKLPDREKEVLELRFGLVGDRTHTLREIGNIFNLSKSTIKRIEGDAISKINILKELKK